MIELTLNFHEEKEDNGEMKDVVTSKTYRQPVITGQHYRKLQEAIKDSQSLSQYEQEQLAVQYIIFFFGYKFTEEEFWNGIELENFVSIYRDITSEVINKYNAGMNKLLKK
ncbi:hypothetical protein IAI10_13100 [Clostridium sp. 19966]|uniref:phage tail assembly chaperone G n=1 Tax=Clostridium sp. 19966 TaxID=2768166 RepID=UPI0028DE78DA|nr:hypothetical protein [Clostridium sp. 19966]MDT8717603.1 hypothetical protein [Clostridium sp. 19966]